MDETEEMNEDHTPPEGLHRMTEGDKTERAETEGDGTEMPIPEGHASQEDELEDFDQAPPGLEPPVFLRSSPDPEAPKREVTERDASQDEENAEALPPMPEVPQYSNELSTEERKVLKRVLMAMLFASTEPLSASRLSEAAGLSVAPIKELLQELREDSLGSQAVFELKKHGDGWRLYTKEEFYPYLVRLRSLKKVERLTPAALETLAIIAYRQPVIRAEVEAIRGVRVGPMLRALLDRKLVSIVGRANVPGAPFQYGTTKSFLERFGLESLSELPSLKEFQQGRI
jgi:segregation and condensation protein B